jgi:hypothetical protein
VALADREVDSMTCARFESDLVDRARGAQIAADRAGALDRHLRHCTRCAARFDREQALSAGLRRLAEDTIAAPIDPAKERRLLAAFDSRRAAPTPRHMRPAAAAALLVAAATLVWIVAGRNRGVDPRPATPRSAATTQAPSTVPAVGDVEPRTPSTVVKRERARRPGAARPRADDTRFVMLPGVDDLPPFESGQLMRVPLAASLVASLGLRPRRPLGDDGVVQTDVLVGQDGYARAVRLVR